MHACIYMMYECMNMLYITFNCYIKVKNEFAMIKNPRNEVSHALLNEKSVHASIHAIHALKMHGHADYA